MSLETTTDAFDAVVRALDDGRDAMVEAVLAGMWAAVPAYRDLGAGDAELVREGVRHTVNQFVDLLAEGRRLSAGELALLESLGGVRAAQGVPMEDMLQAIRVAMSAGWDHILGLVPADAPAPAVVEVVSRLGDEVFEYMQQASARMTAGYTAHERLGLTTRLRARDEAVEGLLSGLFDAEADVRRRAAALGIDLDVPHGLLLLAAPAAAGDAVDALRRVEEALVERLETALTGSVRAAPTPHAVVVVPAPADDRWERVVEVAVAIAADAHVLVLAAGPTLGARGIHACYTDAARLVGIVRRVGSPGQALRPADLGLHRFLDAAGPLEGRAFVRRVLGPLLDLPAEQRDRLLGALRALARSNGLLAEAAELLGVHAKTVSYRLRRLEEATGLEVTRPLDRLQLDTAVLLLDLLDGGA